MKQRTIFFRYTGSLFRKAYKNDLEEEDLYEVLRKCASKRCGDKLEQKWLLEKKKEQPVSIIRLLWKRFGVRYLLYGFIDLVWKLIIRYITQKLEYFNEIIFMIFKV